MKLNQKTPGGRSPYRCPHRHWPRYAIAFAREGAKTCRFRAATMTRAANWLLNLRGLGAEAEFIKADVRHEDEVKNLVEKTRQRFGRLDIAIITPVPKASPADCRANRRKHTLRHLKPMSLVSC